jgi:hypothetical protein
VAALNAGNHGPDPATRDSLVRALGDARRVVRTGAAFSLVAMGTNRLEGPDAARFEAAKADYVARARLHEDDAAAQLDLARFLIRDAHYADAERALRASLVLEPAQRLDYYLAVAELGQGRLAEARQRLSRLRSDDPHASDARTLLTRLATLAK